MERLTFFLTALIDSVLRHLNIPPPLVPEGLEAGGAVSAKAAHIQLPDPLHDPFKFATIA